MLFVLTKLGMYVLSFIQYTDCLRTQNSYRLPGCSLHYSTKRDALGSTRNVLSSHVICYSLTESSDCGLRKSRDGCVSSARADWLISGLISGPVTPPGKTCRIRSGSVLVTASYGHFLVCVCVFFFPQRRHGSYYSEPTRIRSGWPCQGLAKRI